MKLKVETEEGFISAVIDDDCGYSKFYKAAHILETDFNITFTQKIDDFDSLYWIFNYKESKLTLHYNIYLGLSIYPNAVKNATEIDNGFTIELGELLFQKLLSFDWLPFDKEKTLGNKGSEGGKIIADIENSDGARITLERECGNIPFAVTIGIYNLMVHTHFERELSEAKEYIEDTKYLINKIFEMYETEENKRDKYWYDKRQGLMEKLAYG